MFALFFNCVRALSSESDGSQDMNASRLSGVGDADILQPDEQAAEEELGPNRRLKMRRRDEDEIRRA